MATHLLTDAMIDSLEANPERHVIYYDQVTRGLGIRVTKQGAKSFVLNHHVNGKEVRHTLGTFGDIGVRQAREMVEEVNAKKRERGQIEKAEKIQRLVESESKTHTSADRQITTDAPWARVLRENAEAAGHALAARVLELAEPSITEAIRRASWQAIEEILRADVELAREEYRNAA